jgi:hypothetical protein
MHASPSLLGCAQSRYHAAITVGAQAVRFAQMLLFTLQEVSGVGGGWGVGWPMLLERRRRRPRP